MLFCRSWWFSCSGCGTMPQCAGPAGQSPCPGPCVLGKSRRIPTQARCRAAHQLILDAGSWVLDAGRRRITEWFGLEGTLKIIWFQSPCHEQGHLPPAQAAQSSIQPGCEHCQGSASRSPCPPSCLPKRVPALQGGGWGRRVMPGRMDGWTDGQMVFYEAAPGRVTPGCLRGGFSSRG